MCLVAATRIVGYDSAADVMVVLRWALLLTLSRSRGVF